MENKYSIFTDGGSRGNPGHAGYGFVVFNDKKELLFKDKKYIGIATNNQAEYQGALSAIEYIYNNLNNERSIYNFYLDSLLVVEQLNGHYKIRNEDLKELYYKIRELVLKLGKPVYFNHIPREKNRVADALVNEALDEQIKNIN